jgi:hypothetical protein
MPSQRLQARVKQASRVAAAAWNEWSASGSEQDATPIESTPGAGAPAEVSTLGLDLRTQAPDARWHSSPAATDGRRRTRDQVPARIRPHHRVPLQ